MLYIVVAESDVLYFNVNAHSFIFHLQDLYRRYEKL